MEGNFKTDRLIRKNNNKRLMINLKGRTRIVRLISKQI